VWVKSIGEISVARNRRFRGTQFALLLTAFGCLGGLCFAQSQPGRDTSQELISQAVANELKSPFVTQNCTYQYHRQASGGQETRFMIKTSDLIVGKLISVGDVPVSQDQEDKEDRRLQALLTDSRQQDRQRREQEKFEDQMRALIQAIPQAFQFTKTETEAGPDGSSLVHFSFQPSPDFKPANIDLELLRGLAGTMVIDTKGKQITNLQAHLFRDVDFGWGILVRLNKGGTFVLARQPAGVSPTDLREFSLDVSGRVLVLKKFAVRWNFDHFACFREPVALTSAIRMLTNPTISEYFPH
jgi:hypothetical protein